MSPVQNQVWLHAGITLFFYVWYCIDRKFYVKFLIRAYIDIKFNINKN
jgi:hypothetical protein